MQKLAHVNVDFAFSEILLNIQNNVEANSQYRSCTFLY